MTRLLTTSRKFRRSAFTSSVLRFAFVAALVLLVLAIPASAQTSSATDGSTPLGLSPGSPSGSYALSGFESVNPYNGNLSFHLPLRGIVGRGGAHTASMLAIDAKGLERQTPPCSWRRHTRFAYI